MDENNKSLIKNNKLHNNILNEGSKILKDNDFFGDLDYVMSDNSFRSFYSKYFKSQLVLSQKR